MSFFDVWNFHDCGHPKTRPGKTLIVKKQLRGIKESYDCHVLKSGTLRTSPHSDKTDKNRVIWKIFHKFIFSKKLLYYLGQILTIFTIQYQFYTFTFDGHSINIFVFITCDKSSLTYFVGFTVICLHWLICYLVYATSYD
jgi:hypothetical protein